MKFKYKTNCSRKSNSIPFATDTNNCKTRIEAIRFMREYEKQMVNIIEKTTDCTASYYILGNHEVIATANMYDNATLIAEALVSYSPYYKVIDVVSYDGLIYHFLTKDWKHNDSNHCLLYK